MLHVLLEQRLQQAVASVLPDADLSVLRVRPCPDPKFGDYQTNALMALARERKLDPRRLAPDVREKLDVSEWCDQVEIAGAGFLNFRLKPSALAQGLGGAARGASICFSRSPRGRVPSSSTSARPMWPSRCTSATFVPPSWGIAWRAP